MSRIQLGCIYKEGHCSLLILEYQPILDSRSRTRFCSFQCVSLISLETCMNPLICMSQNSETPVFEGLLRATYTCRALNFTTEFIEECEMCYCMQVPLLHNTETHRDAGIRADKGQSVGSSLQKNTIVQTLSSYLSHWYISKPRNMLNNSQYIDINYTFSQFIPL